MVKTGYRDYEADKGEWMSILENIIIVVRYCYDNVTNSMVFFFFCHSFCIAKLTEFLRNYQALDKDNRKHAKYAVQLSKLVHREQVHVVMIGDWFVTVIAVCCLWRSNVPFSSSRCLCTLNWMIWTILTTS